MTKGTPGTTPPPSRKEGTARKASRAEAKARATAAGLKEPRQLLSLPEVGEVLRLSRWTLARMIENGELPAVSIHGRRRVKAADLDAYLDKLDAEAS